jgi:uncharacterized protein YheU (UPF0270 family)
MSRIINFLMFVVVGCPAAVLAGEQLSPDEQSLLTAILASHEAVAESAKAGEMTVQVIERQKAFIHQVEAEVLWDGPRVRWDYRHHVARPKSEESGDTQFEGVMFDTPKLVVNFQRSHKQLFRSVDRIKKYERVFFVTPPLSWFTYSLEFPLREILTADESWDYGDREVSLTQKGDLITMLLNSPQSPGEFRIVFSAAHDGLPISIRHSGRSGPRYHADYEWERAAGVWYPKHLRMFSVKGGDFKAAPYFEMRITRFQPHVSIPSSKFAEQSLEVDETIEITTYRKGAAPIVRKAKRPSAEEQLKELGKSLSTGGFAEEKK